MKLPSTPLRILSKTYASNLISREQYVEIRAQLIKRLVSAGSIGESDLKNYAEITHGFDTVKIRRSFTWSDRIIIILGLAASAVLIYALYG